MIFFKNQTKCNGKVKHEQIYELWVQIQELEDCKHELQDWELHPLRD